MLQSGAQDTFVDAIATYTENIRALEEQVKELRGRSGKSQNPEWGAENPLAFVESSAEKPTAGDPKRAAAIAALRREIRKNQEGIDGLRRSMPPGLEPEIPQHPDGRPRSGYTLVFESGDNPRVHVVPGFVRRAKNGRNQWVRLPGERIVKDRTLQAPVGDVVFSTNDPHAEEGDSEAGADDDELG